MVSDGSEGHKIDKIDDCPLVLLLFLERDG